MHLLNIRVSFHLNVHLFRILIISIHINCMCFCGAFGKISYRMKSFIILLLHDWCSKTFRNGICVQDFFFLMLKILKFGASVNFKISNAPEVQFQILLSIQTLLFFVSKLITVVQSAKNNLYTQSVHFNRHFSHQTQCPQSIHTTYG